MKQKQLKQWLVLATVGLALACTAQASLLGLSGAFTNGSISFTYDGKLLQDGWAIRVYETSSSTVDFSYSKLENFVGDTVVVVYDHPVPSLDSVTIAGIELNMTDNSFVYSVLFDTALPTGGSGSYLLLDTVALNVGAHNPQATYTPGHEIPYIGDVAFSGQTWQSMPVPEPATLSLLGLGSLAMLVRRKWRK